MFSRLMARLSKNETARAVLGLRWRQRGRLVGRLLRDSRIPFCARLIIPLLVLYLLSPIDLIPDFIPVVGYLDDVLVLALAVWAFGRLANPAIVREHASRLMEETKVRPTGPSLRPG